MTFILEATARVRSGHRARVLLQKWATARRGDSWTHIRSRLSCASCCTVAGAAKFCHAVRCDGGATISVLSDVVCIYAATCRKPITKRRMYHCRVTQNSNGSPRTETHTSQDLGSGSTRSVFTLDVEGLCSHSPAPTFLFPTEFLPNQVTQRNQPTPKRKDRDEEEEDLRLNSTP